MAQQAAPGLSRSFAFRRDDSAEDLTAKVRAADEAVALARAEQQAASDRLAREVGSFADFRPVQALMLVNACRETMLAADETDVSARANQQAASSPRACSRGGELCECPALRLFGHDVTVSASVSRIYRRQRSAEVYDRSCAPIRRSDFVQYASKIRS